MNESNSFSRLKPGAGKAWLLFAAGFTWCAVGILLGSYAVAWFAMADGGTLPYLIAAAVLVGLGFYTIIFARFSARNIARIKAYPQQRICLFAFQRWSSYPLVALMISMGIFLRKYSGIPKPLLAPLYIGIGTSLFVAGARYFLAMRGQL